MLGHFPDNHILLGNHLFHFSNRFFIFSLFPSSCFLDLPYLHGIRFNLIDLPREVFNAIPLSVVLDIDFDFSAAACFNFFYELLLEGELINLLMKVVKKEADLEDCNEPANFGKTLPNRLRVHLVLDEKLIYIDTMFQLIRT